MTTDEEMERLIYLCDSCRKLFLEGHRLINSPEDVINLCQDCFDNHFKLEAKDGQEDEKSNQEDSESGICLEES